MVRSTHGVNCTGSCSWKVYVKDGIITWESQQTDYPSTGADRPEYEPRGCPRGAAFSWYTYSPTQGALSLRARRPARDVPRREGRARATRWRAWASIVDDPEKAKRYKSARGKGGLVRAQLGRGRGAVRRGERAHDQEVGTRPDRRLLADPRDVDGQPRRRGARFTSLIGGSMLSFYDWYADLPVASPQIFGRPDRRARSPATGGTPATWSCGARTSR